MTHPQRALDEMALLRDRLSTPDYQAYMTGFEIDTKRKANGPAWVDDKGNPSGYVFCHNEIARLDMAEAYYVDREMIPLIRWAAAGLDDTDRFSHDLWPTDYGFAWFDGGVVGTEAWGRTVVMSAIAWGRVTSPIQGSDGKLMRVPGVMVTIYTDTDDDRDEVTQELKAKAAATSTAADGRMLGLGRLAVMHKVFLADGMRVGPERIPPQERLAEFAVGDWASKHQLAESSNDDRFILAYLMMMGQTVTSVSEHEVDKRAAKRFGRMGLPKRVTVVELRRHSGNRSEGESMVEWAHRWIVRGHWRNQPYKADDGEVEYRKIWIAPYCKGPEDKPLKQSTKIYALLR